MHVKHITLIHLDGKLTILPDVREYEHDPSNRVLVTRASSEELEVYKNVSRVYSRDITQRIQ